MNEIYTKFKQAKNLINPLATLDYIANRHESNYKINFLDTFTTLPMEYNLSFMLILSNQPIDILEIPTISKVYSINIYHSVYHYLIFDDVWRDR